MNKFVANYYDENGRYLSTKKMMCWTVKQAHKEASLVGCNYKLEVYQKRWKPHRVLKRYMALEIITDVILSPLIALYVLISILEKASEVVFGVLGNLTKETKFLIQETVIEFFSRMFKWEDVVKEQLDNSKINNHTIDQERFGL